MPRVTGDWHPLSAPAADHLPEQLRDIVTEYNKLSNMGVAAQRELNDLLARADGAQREDAASLGEAARAGSDLRAVGTPAQDALAEQIRQAQTRVSGLAEAVQSVEIEVRAAFREHAEAGIAMATERVEQSIAPYLAAIGEIEKAIADYEGALAHLAGWHTYIASGSRRIAWSRDGRGSIVVRGQVLAEMGSYGAMTAGLRQHARRHKVILDAIDKSRAEAPAAPQMPARPVDELAATGAAVWDA